MWSTKQGFQSILLPLALCFAGCTQVHGQSRSLENVSWGFVEEQSPRPQFETAFISPSLHRWYQPRHFPETYTQAWHATDTRYARVPYRRYIDSALQGQQLYDPFGNQLGRGWLVYNWNQEQPVPRGSSINKDRTRFSSDTRSGNYNSPTYDGFFSRLVIATDRDHSGSYRLMIGDEIHTSFTPLTFFKPRFNGVRLDYAQERLSMSMVLSRPSQPDGQQRTDATHVFGGHAELEVADFSTIGFTYVNAHNVRTEDDFNTGNPLYGTLSSQQNQSLEKLWIRIRDDSPGKGGAGAVLAGFDIVLVDTMGRKVRGSEIGFLAKVEGGGTRDGELEVTDGESILLEYDLNSLNIDGLQSGALERVRIELAVANDYQIEVASDLQTDGEDFNPEAVFLLAQRAEGNVQDRSNTRVLSLDYGLPTASDLLGINWHFLDWKNFSSQGEVVLNRRFTRYPNPRATDHFQSTASAKAAYVHTAYKRSPGMIFIEAFSIEDEYSTQYWLSDADGRIRYKNPIPQVYEFVDDDDDSNGLPEWRRPYAGLFDPVAWPSYDENGDFLNDHDQNGNSFPDYDEAFVRFRSDRPEFLFGLDMNHNGTIDRFENDALPDFPYKRDHRGTNIYGRLRAGPDVVMTTGRQRMHLISGDGRTKALYVLGAWRHTWYRAGLRVFAQGTLVQDNIPDDLQQWFQPSGTPGFMRHLSDVLPAQDTWKGTLYADLQHRFGQGGNFHHRFKWDLARQRSSRQKLRAREGRRTSGFLGAVNRVDWNIPVGAAFLQPRWKSEFRRDRPYSVRHKIATSVEQTATLLWSNPLMAERVSVGYFPRYGRQKFDTQLQLGVEASRFWLLEGAREEADGSYSDWAWLTQLTNRSVYLGYELVTRIGLRITRRNYAQGAPDRSSLFFLAMNAGLGT
jgi:hypothetical protein